MRLRSLILTLTLALLLASAGVARADLVIVQVDKSIQRMSVSVNGKWRYIWPVSTGEIGYDTPTGTYRPFRLEKDHYSREWEDAPMPYSIFFTPEGHAIHGTTYVRKLGRPASHGCVRLAPRHAAILFSLVKKVGLANTLVMVGGEEGWDSEYLAY